MLHPGPVWGCLGILLLGPPAVTLPAVARVRGRAPFFAAALVVTAASLVALLTALSLFDAMTSGAILVGQLAIAGGSVVAWSAAGCPRPPRGWRPPSLEQALRAARAYPAIAVLVVATCVGLAVEFAAAVVIAPNHWDSMTYHLSRAAYWLHDHSAMRFAGGSVRQNGSAPDGEMLQAWTLALTGRDVIAQLVQWVCLLGIGALVMSGARLLRFGLPASIFAAALFMTMPQPIMQSSTTQNDLIVTFFIAAVAFFGVRGLRDRHGGDLVIASLAGGLAIGTKGSTFFAAPSLALLLGAALWRYRPPARLVTSACACGLAAVVALGVFRYAENTIDTGSAFGGLSREEDRTSPLPINTLRVAWAFVDTPKLPVPDALENLRPAKVVPFSYGIDTSVQEDTSAFGVTGMLLWLPVMVMAALGPRTSGGRRLLAVSALAYLFAYAGVSQANPSAGRFLIASVALGAPLLAYLGSRPWTRAAALLLALIGLLPSLYFNRQKQLQHVPKLDRIAQQSLTRPVMDRVVRRFEALVPPRATVGVVAGGDSWDYPLFGERRTRHLMRLRRSEVSPQRMAEAGMDAVIFENVGRPPRGLRYEVLAIDPEQPSEDYFLVRSSKSRTAGSYP
jgi:hypothetical protein